MYNMVPTTLPMLQEWGDEVSQLLILKNFNGSHAAMARAVHAVNACSCGHGYPSHQNLTAQNSLLSTYGALGTYHTELSVAAGNFFKPQNLHLFKDCNYHVSHVRNHFLKRKVHADRKRCYVDHQSGQQIPKPCTHRFWNSMSIPALVNKSDIDDHEGLIDKIGQGLRAWEVDGLLVHIIMEMSTSSADGTDKDVRLDKDVV